MPNSCACRRSLGHLVFTVVVAISASLLTTATAFAAPTTAATMQSPTPGSTFPGTAVTFTWSAGTNVNQYALTVGSTSGGADLYNANLGTSTSATVSGLPADGRTIYVKLSSRAANNSKRWLANNYTYTAYTAVTPVPATMTSPAPGTVLSGSSVMFTWSTGTGVTQYSLAIGSTQGGSDLYSANEGTSTSATVNNLPTDGRTLYVTLGSLISNAWQYNSYTYKAAGGTTTAACDVMSTGQGASLNGYIAFDSTSPWNQDISAAPVDTNSAAIINFIGSTVGLHPDFGAGTYNGSTMGIPYIVVDSTQAMANIAGVDGTPEGDASPMPIPASAPIEGYPNDTVGDRHVLVLQKGSCWLYELYGASVDTYGNWSAGGGFVWDLLGNEQRPYTWTSADAAGLPIFAGLVRYDEVAGGAIKHALRFTLAASRQAFVPPATHWSATSTSQYAAPMGMRMRLKASFDVSGFSPANQVILNALKKYGMIMADNGSSMFLTGAPDDRWDNTDLHNLTKVTAANFEVVQMNPIYTSSNIPTGRVPLISSLTASAYTVAAGTPVTLSWNVSGASYLEVSPQVGPVRGASVTVTPTQTTTYTLFATNQYGRNTATVTINVQ